MKKAKGINKLIVLVMLVTMAFLSMGVSSWLIISENGFFPGFSPLITPTVDTSGFNTSGTATYNIYGREETIPGVTITGENGETLTGTFETAQTKLTSGNSVTLNAATIKFIPDSEYSDTYSEVTFTLTANITLKAVAKRGDAYYTTIDAALQATSGNEIIVTETFSEYCTFKNVTASTSVTAYTNLLALTVKTAQEVKSGVTLILPCAPETTDKEDDELSETTDLKHVKQFKSGVYKQTNEDKRGNNAPATNLYSNISVANGHTLTNNGTILIGGVISGGGAHSSINS
ncbi:MAG: hypothetical protein IKT32_01415, partial [Clostridia bacterium]|nr:hypothetical protein [Clostridia bacterium]